MTITASEVNELRKKTGAGLMDCKKALVEVNGDLEAAIDYLRKKGQKVSELRAGKQANEGVAFAKVSDDNKVGVVINLSSETDFVAKNEEFVAFAQGVVDLALSHQPESLDDLLGLTMDGLTVKEKVDELVGKINEKIELAKYDKIAGECVIPYNHAGYKIGVLVLLNQAKTDQIEGIGKDIAMQIAAMNPVAVDQDGVGQAIIDREFEIGKEQAVAEGKPEAIVDKIAQGKLQKFFKENTLVNQQFVKDTSKTVAQVLKEVDEGLKVVAFKRIALGS